MADFKLPSDFASIQIISGPFRGPQNSTNQAASNSGQTNFVSGGGSSNDSQYIGTAQVIYVY